MTADAKNLDFLLNLSIMTPAEIALKHEAVATQEMTKQYPLLGLVQQELIQARQIPDLDTQTNVLNFLETVVLDRLSILINAERNGQEEVVLSPIAFMDSFDDQRISGETRSQQFERLWDQFAATVNQPQAVQAEKLVDAYTFWSQYSKARLTAPVKYNL